MQTQIMSIISSNLLGYLWTSNSKNKSMGTLLDPINTVIALSLLNHYPEGTKISIQNNEINFQEPGTIQSVSRWSKGDKFEDLHNLINPIKKFLEKKGCDALWGKDHKNFIYLCNSMQCGLNKLAITYKDNLIANHTIEFYKSLVSENLQNKKHFLEKLNTDSGEDKSYDIYKEFFEEWNYDEINLLIVLLDNIGKQEKQVIKSAYIQSITTIINSHNTLIKNIINRIQSGIV